MFYALFIKARSRRLGGFLLCTRFIFFFKPLSRRLGGFLLCTRFIHLFFFSHVGEQTQTPTHGQLSSPDDVIISQLQAISQLFSSYPPSGGFCQVSELTVYTKKWRPKGENVNLIELGPKSFGDGRQDICKDKASNLGPAAG